MVNLQRNLKLFFLMVKAIFFDVDGTLVSFKTHKVPASTREALRLLRAKGVKVFIATGRPKMLMMEAVGDLEFDGYVTLNGSHCFTADHQDIYKNCIPKDDIERLTSYCRRYPEIPFVFVDESGWYITHINDDVENVSRLLEVSVPPLMSAEAMRNKDVLQIMGYFGESEEPKFFSEVLTHCVPMRWHPLFADIIVRGNSKSEGIDRVLAYYGMDLSETMAFGDGGNDIPMLCHVALGVAMGNAAEPVRSAANYVTTSVDDDGILNALKHFNVL